ncbi:MAG: eukaryotic-like serine/threonine-protein kinase [Actinomycetota bacterium]|nr:eukaryotic-like serine/threonine-protein kinase [Actinomycetota bacterium]
MEVVEKTVAGRYRLLDRLGSGGMGTVWRAQDTVLDRDVAVKQVTFPPGVSDEEREVLRERTRREARAAARLDHPSAVTVYDVVEEDGTPYLVMELVDARTLAEVVRTDGPLSPRRTAQVGLAVLGALETAHAQGIVHRDVKPSNVLLRDDGRVVLTDFGIATFTGDSSITSTGLLLGSPSYIAPERARGDAPGPPSDLWSLGATLFTAVEGRPPYDKGQPLPTLTEVVTGEHAPFVAAGALAPIIDGLLEKDPTRRYDAERACAELTHVVAEEPDTGEAAAVPAAPATTRRTDRTTAMSLGKVAEEVRQEEQSPVTPYPGEPELRHTYAPPRVLPAQGVPRRSRAPLVLGVLALALAIGVGLLLSPAFRNRAGDLATPGGGTSHSSGAGGTSAKAADVPAGWVTHSDSGWTVAVPASYTPGSFNGFPQFKDRTTGRTLRVSTTAAGGGKSDAVADRKAQAAAFAAKHQNYREIAIQKADYRGLEAADWEFTYDDGGASLHAFDRVFVVNGRGYSLFFQTHSTDDWTAAKADFDKIAAAFKP